MRVKLPNPGIIDHLTDSSPAADLFSAIRRLGRKCGE
jgi:hypothetical protein